MNEEKKPNQPNEKQKLFEFVRRSTEIARSIGVVKIGDDGKPSPMPKLSDSTAKAYRRNAASRMPSGERGDFGTLLDGVERQSFYAIKAALQHELSVAYRERRKACDKAQSAGNMAEAQKQAVAARMMLLAYQRVIETPAPEAKPRQKLTKRASLRTMPRSWQEAAFDAASEVQKPAIAVLWAAGCRPREIESGVQVAVEEQGIRLRINGAKVTEPTKHKPGNGQPWREIWIDPDSAPGKAMLAVLDGRNSLEIQRKAKRIGADFDDIKKITGISEISAYSFRHQFSSNLKAANVEKTDIAAAMGHASTLTQQRYGSTAAGSKSAVSPVVAVNNAREVRHPEGQRKEQSPNLARDLN